MFWAFKKRLKILFFSIIFLAIFVGIPIYFLTYQTPNCKDGFQNGDETGIDCGGSSCTYLCISETVPPKIDWQQSFKVNGGMWSAFAFIENPNRNAFASNVSYIFRIYDDQNILVAERAGKATIPAGKTFGILEPQISVGARIPAKTTFEFTEIPMWQKTVKLDPLLTISSQKISNLEASPRLDLSVENKSNSAVSKVELTAVIYDKDSNALGASKTIIDKIDRGKSASAVFTWPIPFAGKATMAKIMYKML
ncbi:MAG: hypothetical protein WCT19_01885 [Candidatus Paceibacterota bacterium]